MRSAVPRQMARVYEDRRGVCSGSRKSNATRPTDTESWQRVRVAPRLSQVERIVEKPKPADAPSTLAVVGRYILRRRSFEKLESTGRGAGGEIQLTDGIAALLRDEKVFAYAFEGTRYDCGSKLGYLEATVEFGLKHPEFGKPFSEYLSRVGGAQTRLTRLPGSWRLMSRNEDLQKRRDAAIARALQTSCPCMIERARNAELWDADGRRYIDFAAGIAVVNTGHVHPQVQAAAAKQLDAFTHTCFMVTPYEVAVELAERLNRAGTGSDAQEVHASSRPARRRSRTRSRSRAPTPGARA